jgi:tetrahydromethanopterin S-methyltransferase subunit G
LVFNMKQSDTKRILELLTQLTEAVGVPPPGPPPSAPKASLSDRLGRLDDRVSEVQLGLATLAVSTTAQFQKIDERFTTIDKRFDEVNLQFKRVDARFDHVEGSIESARVQLVDLVGRVHSELTGRIIDLEVPGPGGRDGGGRGSGGVPLAS